MFDVGGVSPDLFVGATTDLQHFGAGDTFRVGQIRSSYQRAAQRD